MSEFLTAAGYISAVFLMLCAGYIVAAALTWYVVGVIWNFSPRFRRWLRKNR